MTLNFPSAPSDGQLYEGYQYDASKTAWIPFTIHKTGPYLLGVISAWASEVEPSWGLFLNGQTIVGGATSYSGLAALHPSWVVGEDLVLPDWGGKVPVGYKAGDDTFFTLGANVGEKTYGHDHGMSTAFGYLDPDGGANRNYYRQVTTPSWQADAYSSGTVAGSTSSGKTQGLELGGQTEGTIVSAVQPSVIVNWVICVATSSGNFDTEVQTALVSSVTALQARNVTVENCRFQVVRSAGSVTAGNYINYNEVDYDPGSDYTIATGTFTAPVNGFYEFYIQDIGSNSSRSRLYLRKNDTDLFGGVHLRMPSSQSDYQWASLSYGIELLAGDTMRVYVGEGAAFGQRPYSLFSGKLVHPL